MPPPTEQTDFVRSHLLPEDATAQGYWAQRGRLGLTGLARDQGISHRSKVCVPGTRRFDRQLNTSLRSHAFMQDDADLSPYAKVLLQREEAKAKACADAAATEIRRSHVPPAPLPYPFPADPASIPQRIPPPNTEFILSAPYSWRPRALIPHSKLPPQSEIASLLPSSHAGPSLPAAALPADPVSTSAAPHAPSAAHTLSDPPSSSRPALSLADAYLAARSTSSAVSSSSQDAAIFAPGDRLAHGMQHNGSVVQVLGSIPGASECSCGIDGQLEVVRKLSHGGDACMYLVKEAGHAQGPGETDEGTRLFALKCLSKRGLAPDMVSLLRLKASIHQSLPADGNIVNLYRAYETPDWLFLVLEYCPGNDLFFWLEQAQDELKQGQPDEDPTSRVSDLRAADPVAHDPSLLTTTSGFSILSWHRLHLISCMFQQMCSAVQFCHDHGVAHRDLKPENFIVVDSPAMSPASAEPQPLAVKLTDFGLATRDVRCTDVECGSKPYLSYECCNDTETPHDPKLDDVWALGIILLNMLFHRNPFQEPSAERCSSFAAFEQDPVRFLTSAFDGLTPAVASYLSSHVFNKASAGGRVSAAELGTWSASLCKHLGLAGPDQRPTLSKGASMGITSALSRTHSVHAYSRSLFLPSHLPLVADLVPVTIPLALRTSSRIAPDTLPLALAPAASDRALRPNPSPPAVQGADAVSLALHHPAAQTSEETLLHRDTSLCISQSKSTVPLPGSGPSLSARRGAGNTLTVTTSHEPSDGLSPVLGSHSHSHSHDQVLDSSDDEVASVASSVKPRRRKRGNRKGSVALRAREAAQTPGPATLPSPTPTTPSSRTANGSERLCKAPLPPKPMTPSEHPLSWRERKPVPPGATVRTSISSMRLAQSDDQASIHSTASAPAEVLRRSYESALKPSNSITRLQPISEQREKAKATNAQLDASFLAEMFGGPSQPRTRPDRRRRADMGWSLPEAISPARGERADHLEDYARADGQAHQQEPTPAPPKRQPRGPPADPGSALPSFRTCSSRDRTASSLSSHSALSFATGASDLSARETVGSNHSASGSSLAVGGNGKKSGLAGKGFSKLFRM